MRRLVLIGLMGATSGIISFSAWATSAKLPPGYITCPEINQFHKDPNEMIWRVPGGNWRSSAISFADHLTQFLGAQWQGINVGSIICLYQSNDTMDFPVAVQFDQLVYMPTGGKWTQNLGGYANCQSHAPTDCLMKPRRATIIKNPYLELEKFKNPS